MRYFNLFSNIHITKGFCRILIADLQRNVSELYPLEFLGVIDEFKSKSIDEVLSLYDDDSKEIIEEYLQILLDQEYGFVTYKDWDNNFPQLSLEYNNPSVISNCFFEFTSIQNLKKIYDSVENLQISQLVIFSDKNLSLDDLLNIDGAFARSVLQGIEVYSPYHNLIDMEFITTLNNKSERIHSLWFYNCSEIPFKIKRDYRFDLQFSKNEVKTSCCGVVKLNYFNTNLTKVSEAVNHNSCLHKKIAIDKFGNIKNCPNMNMTFGNIHKNTIDEAISHNEFQKYWNLTKDEIEVCKDCEFRYICTDCRAYTERTHSNEQGLDISKPLKCGYNPYKGEWEEWSTNPLKQKAIKYYGMQGLVKHK